MTLVMAKLPRVDGFGMTTRVLPGALVVAPAAVATVALAWGPTKWWGAILGVLASCGGFWFAEQFARSAGKRLEPILWERWGGPPTIRRLRHHSAGNPILLARRHRQLEALTAEAFPTDAEEKADPATADHRYEMAAIVLREKTRDHKQYPLVYTELRNYNFRRNLLGLRRLGLAVSLGTIVATLTASVIAVRTSNGTLSIRAAIVATGAGAVCAVLWWRTVTEKWVSEAADAYAESLLAAAEHLVGSPAVQNAAMPPTPGKTDVSARPSPTSSKSPARTVRKGPST